MHSREALVSNFALIGRKRETRGNETGNERETKWGFPCKIGNEGKTRYGNETGFFRRLRFLRIRAMRPCYPVAPLGLCPQKTPLVLIATLPTPHPCPSAPRRWRFVRGDRHERFSLRDDRERNIAIFRQSSETRLSNGTAG
jgi:hypothetical protein